MSEHDPYKKLATQVRDDSKAEGAMVLIYKGEYGDGFAVHGPPEMVKMLPKTLRELANRLESASIITSIQ